MPVRSPIPRGLMNGTSPPSPFRLELGETLRLAVPLVVANILQMAVFAIDVMFVARLGQEALAASSLAVALFALINFGFTGLTGAVAPLIAAERGRRANAVREIRRSVRMGLWLAVLCGLIGMAACALGERLMLATGQSPILSERAGGFLFVLSFALMPMLIANVLRTFVSAMGRPVFATAITALAILVNALGNWTFVFGHLGMPALGLTGSALSSVVTAIAMAAAYVVAIRSDRRLRRFHLFGRLWRPEWPRMRQLSAIGLPIGLTIIAEAGLFSAAAFLMGRIGEAELAAHTVALQIAAIFFQVPFGIGQAATIRVGYHYGAGDAAAIGRAGWASLLVSFGFMFISSTAMLFAPTLLLSAYVDTSAPDNLALVALAVPYLAVGAAFQLFDGVQAVAAGVLRGVQDTRIPMIVAVTGYWLPGFGTSIWLGLNTPLEGVGIWIGLAVGLTVVAALLLLRWHWRERLGLVPALSAR